MNEDRDAGPYTITTGLFRGNEHTYVTHRATGKQWVSKSPNVNKERSLEWLTTSVECGIIKFDPKKHVGSCDVRFWQPVETRFVPKLKPKLLPASAFDALVFIGE